MTLASTVDEIVTKELESIEIEKITAPKKIRDALTGTFVLHPWEINILDLPMVQRLRRIGQTALAYLTYPSTTHNRFQHTLGVTNIVNKLATTVKERPEYTSLIDENDIRELRIGALLHDVGHLPFSHATEEIIDYLPEMQMAKKLPKFDRVHSKPHEILSYYIVTSDSFKSVFDQINDVYHLNINSKRSASMIIGNLEEYERENFISDFLNGPFDADKLDYMPRDAYFSGLKMDVDLERIAQTCLITDKRICTPRRLCCDISGAHNLEQILFNKVLLHTAMYHHHKVRASVCMIKSIFEVIKDRKLSPEGLNFDDPASFLCVDDCDVLASFRKEPLLKELVNNIRNRNLLKRAAVISRKTVKTKNQLQNLNKQMEKPEDIQALRQLIVDELKKKGFKCSLYDLWVDLPKPPSLNEPSLCWIRITEKDYVPLSEVFPADWWLTAYYETKWKGFVFCPPNNSLREAAYEATKRVLKRNYGIELNIMAKKLAKI